MLDRVKHFTAVLFLNFRKDSTKKGGVCPQGGRTGSSGMVSSLGTQASSVWSNPQMLSLKEGGLWGDRHRTGPVMEIGVPVQGVVVRRKAERW